MRHLPRQHPALVQGFTLIEIMAVLIVIGIAAAVITVSVGDATRPQQTKTVARQLYGAMNLALEDAVFLNRQIGLRFDYSSVQDELAYSYQWLYFDAEKRQWQDLPIEGFEQRDLPVFVQLELEIEGQKVVIGTDKKDDAVLTVEEDKDGKKGMPDPDLYFLSSGEMQAFKIAISDKDTPDSQYVITGDALGQMTFKRPDESDE